MVWTKLNFSALDLPKPKTNEKKELPQIQRFMSYFISVSSNDSTLSL